MLLKNRGYCPSSFLPRFQLSLISVAIALPACVPLSPVLVICAYFLFGCCYSFWTNSPCPVFLVWGGGGQAAVFHNWCNC